MLNAQTLNSAMLPEAPPPANYSAQNRRAAPASGPGSSPGGTAAARIDNARIDNARIDNTRGKSAVSRNRNAAGKNARSEDEIQGTEKKIQFGDLLRRARSKEGGPRSPGRRAQAESSEEQLPGRRLAALELRHGRRVLGLSRSALQPAPEAEPGAQTQTERETEQESGSVDKEHSAEARGARRIAGAKAALDQAELPAADSAAQGMPESPGLTESAQAQAARDADSRASGASRLTGAQRSAEGPSGPAAALPGGGLGPSMPLTVSAETSSGGRVEVRDNRRGSALELPRNHPRTRRARAAAARPGQGGPAPAESGKFAVLETEIGASPRTEGRPAPGSALSGADQLARRLDAEAGSEIVRQVKVVLNRADAGEIRINLRPEHLGRVRVRIRMEDNRLSGRIFVESAAAREAFRSALEGLQVKLVESGFGAADLELAWDQQSTADPRGSQGGPGDDPGENLGDNRKDGTDRGLNGGPASESAAGEFEAHGALSLDGAPGRARVNLVV